MVWGNCSDPSYQCEALTVLECTLLYRIPLPLFSVFLHRNNQHFLCLLTRYLWLYSCCYFLRVISTCICRTLSVSFAAWSSKRPPLSVLCKFLFTFVFALSLFVVVCLAGQETGYHCMSLCLCVTVAEYWLLSYSIAAKAVLRGTFLFGNITTVRYSEWELPTHWFDSPLHCIASWSPGKKIL